ncbi:MAG: YhfG family protein [Spirochaetaceae bacterium]
MIKKSFEEKVEFIKKSRLKNYKESLRLEGLNPSVHLHGKTRAEIISYYTHKK